MRSKRSVSRESSADIPQNLKQDDSLSFNTVNECDEALHHLNELKIELLSIMDKKKDSQVASLSDHLEELKIELLSIMDKKDSQEASLSDDTERMMHHFDEAQTRIDRIKSRLFFPPLYLWIEMRRIRHKMLDKMHSLKKKILEFFHLENSQPSILKALFCCDRVMHCLESIKFVIKPKHIKIPQDVRKKQMDLFGDSSASDAGETKKESSNATDTGTAGGEKIRRSNTATSKSDFFEKPSSVDVSSLFNDNCWAPLVLSLPHNRFIDYCDEILQNIKELQIKLHNIEDQEKVVRKSPLSDDRDGILNNKSIASHIHKARLSIDRIKFFIIDKHDVFSTDDLRREILRVWMEIKCDILKLSRSYFSSIEAQFYCDQVIRNLKSLKFFVQARIKHQQHMYREKSQNLSHKPRSFWDRDSLASDPGDVKKDSFSEVEIAGSTVGSEETKGETLGLVDFQHLKLDDLPADTETPTTVIKENVGKVNVYDSESSVSKDALEPGPDGIPEVSSSTVDVVGSTSARSDSEETISTTELYDFQELKFDNRPTNTKTTTEVKDNAKVTVARLDSGETKEFNDFQELDLDDYTSYSLGDGITKQSSSAVDNVSATVATLQSAETIKETLGLDDFQQLRLDDDSADSESSAEISHENGGEINVYDSELSVPFKDALEPDPDGILGVRSGTDNVVVTAAELDAEETSSIDDASVTVARLDNGERSSTLELEDFQELELDDNYTETTTKVIDETGGNINIYDCEITVSPGAVKSPTEFQLTISDYADDFPDEMLRITPVLECKPSMSFKRPVTLRMRTNFCAMDGKQILAKIMYKKGENSWTVVEHVSLRNRNVVEFQLLHFCKYCCGIDKEFCSQGLFNFHNIVYIHKVSAQIAAVLCRNEVEEKKNETRLEKSDFHRFLPITEEIETKLNSTIKLHVKCSSKSQVQLGEFSPRCQTLNVSPRIFRRRAKSIYFTPPVPDEDQTGQLRIIYKIIQDEGKESFPLIVQWPFTNKTCQLVNVSTEINNGPVVSKYTVKSGGNMKATEDSASSTITLGDNVETSHSSGGH